MRTTARVVDRIEDAGPAGIKYLLPAPIREVDESVDGSKANGKPSTWLVRSRLSLRRTLLSPPPQP